MRTLLIVAMAVAVVAIILHIFITRGYYAKRSRPEQNIAHQKSMQQLAQNNLELAHNFLANNGQNPDVVTLQSGLQYKVVRVGTGPTPTANDKVLVDYEGRLLDGTVFDSSYKRKKPALFDVSGLIPGWREALQLMKVGAVWELYIPPKLAYGALGAAPIIGPNQLLIFKLHLLAIGDKSS